MYRFLAAASSLADPRALSGIAGRMVDVANDLGGLGAASLIALGSLFPPLPPKVILPLTGFTASTGNVSFTLPRAILWYTAGPVVGAQALYGAGALLGRERMRKFMGKLPLIKTLDIERTEAFFDRRGAWTVFLGRMIPIFRSLVSIPTGMTRMGSRKFTVLTTTRFAVWNAILIWTGHALGSN